MRCARHLTWLAALALGCAPEPLSVRVVAPHDDTPYVGADRVYLVLEQQSRPQSETATEIPVDAPVWPLTNLAHGFDLRLRVEARRDALVLARGRSHPFDHPANAPPEGSLDVTLGTLGRFGLALADPELEGTVEDALAILPIAGGALWMSATGQLQHYESHGPRAHAQLTTVGRSELPAEARWSALSGVGLVGIAGERLEAWSVHGERSHAIRSPRLALHDATSVLAVVDGAVLLAGGATSPTAVTRVELGADGARILTLPDLPGARVEASGRATPVLDAADRPTERLLLFGGAPTSSPWLVDPRGEAPTLTSTAALPTRGSALAVLATGLVAIAGGEQDGAVTDAIAVFVVRRDTLTELSPAPPRLFVPRRDAATVELPSGAVLFVGGMGDGDTPLGSAELLEVRLDELPGDVSATGRLASPAGRPRAALLDDGTTLVVGGGAASLYFDPREL
ncbi:MAG: hypothetical protein RLP09_22585 [Sandaracinaceae bacterium]